MHKKVCLSKVHEYYHYVDNGGVSVTIKDNGSKHGGIKLSLDSNYYGYASVGASIHIDSLGAKWLREVALMLLAAADEIDTIDWDARYNET